MLVLTPRVKGSETFDRTAYYRPLRFRTFGVGVLSKIITVGLMSLMTARHVIFNNVREIHAGHILSYGPVGWLFQKVFGIPCFLWVYGGETSDAYKRSKPEALVVILDRDPDKVKYDTDHFLSKEMVLKKIEESVFELDSLETFLPQHNVYIIRLKT